MRILVTGGAGFIGSFLCERLQPVGHKARVLDKLDPQVHPHGAPSYFPPEVESRPGDVRDRAARRSGPEVNLVAGIRVSTADLLAVRRLSRETHLAIPATPMNAVRALYPKETCH